jgi:hypothetical protein
MQAYWARDKATESPLRSGLAESAGSRVTLLAAAQFPVSGNRSEDRSARIPGPEGILANASKGQP